MELQYLPLVGNVICLLVWGHPFLAGLGEKMDDISNSFTSGQKLLRLGVK